MEENHIYTILNTPRLWYRKLDDTFAITSHDLGGTLRKLHDIDENIENKLAGTPGLALSIC